jgi:asparagine synthase (glutamine-hydrolysing)
MCGIVGEWRLDGRPVDSQQLIAARDVLRSRGPDDAGIHVLNNVGLAHRRLSIIDLSPAGRMPMFNEMGDVWAVFNGEIYNFAALRDELVAAGHTFRSRTDSEVVIHAYEEWGLDSFARFDGMFAIAIWDARAKRMLLARDITGEKPLFYRHQPNRQLVFASTLAPLLSYDDAPVDLDPVAVRHYAELGFVPAPESIVRGVAKVEPGCAMVFSETGAPVAHRYWRFETAALADSPTRRLSLDAATDQLHDLLRASVRSRLVSDVPLGAFLSGGVDSSLVVALMAERERQSVRTFTIGFRDAEYDESEYAHRVAKHLGVENTTMVLSAEDVLRELPNVATALDEPMADYSVLPSMAVARLARRHVTVALTGDGADEAFGGYRYYGGTRLFETMTKLVPATVRTQMSKWSSLLGNARLERAVRRTAAPDAAVFFGRSGFYRGSTADSLGMILPRDGHPAVEQVVADYIRGLPSLRATEAGMLWDATQTLSNAWLTKVDRTTMASSLEARAPFLQRQVLEFAFALPLDYRVRGNEKKIILRRILSRYLPRELIERPKQGFTAPLKSWFAKELKDELHDRLAAPRISRFGLFDATGVAKLLADHEAGRADHTQLLWALFHLDRWHETFIENRPRAAA